jgi:hypothetical protein
MWFRRANAAYLREKARRYRSMAVEPWGTLVSARLLKRAAELEARADKIESSHHPAAVQIEP